MRFIAKTETLRKVVEVLQEIGATDIDELIPNDKRDIGAVLLERVTAMKKERKQIGAGKATIRNDQAEISQGKPFKTKR